MTVLSMHLTRLVALAVALLMCGAALADTTRPTPAQQALARAAEQQKFAFILFYRTSDPLTESIAKTLADGVAKREDKATDIHIQVTNPIEKPVLDAYNVGRASLPVVVAVAPNGAVTGIFQRKLDDRFLDEALVTPGTAHCMKMLQEGKLVLLCVDSSRAAPVPAAVGDFKVDPAYKDRLVVMSLVSDDANETRFLKSLEIDPDRFDGSAMVLMTPPGTVVGKYPATATKEQLTADLERLGRIANQSSGKPRQRR